MPGGPYNSAFPRMRVYPPQPRRHRYGNPGAHGRFPLLRGWPTLCRVCKGWETPSGRAAFTTPVLSTILADAAYAPPPIFVYVKEVRGRSPQTENDAAETAAYLIHIPASAKAMKLPIRWLAPIPPRTAPRPPRCVPNTTLALHWYDHVFRFGNVRLLTFCR